MKILACILFLMLCSSAFGQRNSNSNASDSSKSLLVNMLGGKYDLIIGYKEESYWWRDKQYYKVLARKLDSWTSIEIISTRKKNGKVQTKLKRSDFPKDSAAYILSVFFSQDFWTLNHDSLNLKGVAINDSITTIMDISDGENNKFEILDQNGYRVIESFMPESYLAKFPCMVTRRKFVICKNIFLGTWKLSHS